MPNIGFDNSAIVGPNSATPWTFAYTNNGNFLVIAFLGNAFSGITYAGVAMTAAAGSPVVHAVSGSLSIFYLKNPATGTNNFVATLTGGGNANAAIASYTNVDFAASPEATTTDLTSNCAAGSPAPYTINPLITTVSDNDWIVNFGTGNAAWTAHAGTNLRQIFGSGAYLADRGPLSPAGAYGTTVDSNFNGGNNIASLTLALKPQGLVNLTENVNDAETLGDLSLIIVGNLNPSPVAIQHSSKQIWSDEQLAKWESDAIDQVVQDVDCIYARECIPIFRGVSVYTLPAYVRTLRRVTYRGKSLDAESWEELTMLTPATVGGFIETSLSRPVYYAMHPTNPYDIRLYPTPNENFTVQGEPNPYAPTVNSPSCIIDYYREPDTTNTNPINSLPKYILRRTQKAYVLWKAFLAEGDGQDLNAAKYYKSKYDFLIDKFRAINEGCFVGKKYSLEDGSLVTDAFRYPRPILPTNFERERF